MAVQNPPSTGNLEVDFILLDLVTFVNSLEQKNLKLINDIREATDLADLQTRIDE